MNRRTWHLDINFDKNLFSKNWSPASNELLLKLFKHLDSTDQPVLSMLPPGVSAAGAVAAASLYFLPGLGAPPKPHCRIAVYPGLHFVRQMKTISFDPVLLWKASQKSRAAQRVRYAGVAGAFDRLRLKHKEAEEVFFQWMFRCQRLWLRGWTPDYRELERKASYGKDDPYKTASVDFIETEHLDFFSDKYNPYDLLIYCPHFHSRTLDQTEQDIDKLVSKIALFSAHRKLVVARSPFDYWSRRLEGKLRTKGIALVSEHTEQVEGTSYQSGIQFSIVDQFVTLTEAQELFDGIQLLGKSPGVDHSLINEMKFVLRRLLVSLDPAPIQGEESLEDLAYKLLGFASSLQMSTDSPGWRVLESIKIKVSSLDGPTKLKKLHELVSNENYEIWVTKDLDRRILTDFKQKHGLNFIIRLADRWMAPGIRDLNKKVILSRIDREGDLDLTAYLKTNDTVVISAWEAVIRGASIMTSWERSERWREHAKNVQIIDSDKKVAYSDPVLDLTSFLLSKLELGQKTKKTAEVQDSVKKEEQPSWWDDNDAGSILDTRLDRAELLSHTGGKTYLCRELHFEGNFGIFFREDDELQVLEEDQGDGDIITVPFSGIEPGMTVILFKDAERSSMFDILMDQLERSSTYHDDAKMVREWKEKLREYAIQKELKTHDFVAEYSKRGRTLDHVTIRSWFFGSTMAPMRIDNLSILIEILGFDTNAHVLFKSVKNLRAIARTLGRALNEIILKKDINQVDQQVRTALADAGIDIDELSSAIETRRVTDVFTNVVEIEGRNIRKIYRIKP